MKTPVRFAYDVDSTPVLKDKDGSILLKLPNVTESVGRSIAILMNASASDEEKPTLRDQFAMAALTALQPDTYFSESGVPTLNESVATAAYRIADAMMKARAK